MATVLTAAILCGALSACCTSPTQQLHPTKNRATGTATLVQILDPLRTSYNEKVTHHGSGVTNSDLRTATTNQEHTIDQRPVYHGTTIPDAIFPGNDQLPYVPRVSTHSLNAEAGNSYSQLASLYTNTEQKYSQPTETANSHSQPASLSAETSGSSSQPASLSTETSGSSIQPASLSTETSGSSSQPASLSTETSGSSGQPASLSTETSSSSDPPSSLSTETSGSSSQLAPLSAETSGSSSQLESLSTETSGSSSQPASLSTETSGSSSQPAPLSTKTSGSSGQTASLSTETSGIWRGSLAVQQPGSLRILHGEGHYATPTRSTLPCPASVFASNVGNQNTAANGGSNFRDSGALDSNVHDNISLDRNVRDNSFLDRSVPDSNYHESSVHDSHSLNNNAPSNTSLNNNVLDNDSLDSHAHTNTYINNDSIEIHVNAPDNNVSAIPPPVAANTSLQTFPHLRGLRTRVEGDRAVFEVNADFLVNCEKVVNIAKDVSKRDKNMIYINNETTSFFTRWTLKIDVRADEVIQEPNTEELFTSCKIGIKAAETSFVALKKVTHLEVAADSEFQIDVAFGSEVLRKSIDRPLIYMQYNNPIDIRFYWLRKPQTFSMEVQYTLLDIRESRRVQKDDGINITWTSPLQGFVRSFFWDGLTRNMLALGESFLLHGRVHHIRQLERPKGHHTMISWEHIGISDTSACSPSIVSLHFGNEPEYFYCSGTTPSPVVMAGTSAIIIGVSTTVHSFYVGFSMRFSSHNLSALPHQLADKSWNCSVPHWPDFKQHLLCNLLTECAGGEDEADCPYTVETCGHGYLAAGGSCFTFDISPTAATLTSWTEADAACRRRGARLPTLNTPAKWQAVLDLLSHRGWEKIFIGLTVGDPSLPDLYSRFLQWSDSSVAYYTKAGFLTEPCSQWSPCAFLRNDKRPDFVYLDSCSKKVAGSLLCEIEPPRSRNAINLAPENKLQFRINGTRCPKGHVTHTLLSCDQRSDCFANCHMLLSASMTSLPPAFLCHNGFERVPFTLVCDHREDCSDASDEICVLPACQEFECNNKQCIARHKTCDRVKDCLDGSDEIFCRSTYIDYSILNFSKPLPAMVLHDGKGLYDLLDIVDSFAQPTSSDNSSSTEGCPDSHFQCPGVSYYCLPVYVRCNGVHDCPGHQDEVDCDTFECPGFFRCRGSKICLHNDYLCDGIFQCPQRDDELMCGFVCPAGCTCYGLAFYCSVPFDASRHTGLRFLDASGSGMNLKGLSNNTMLFYLSLFMCNITQLVTMNFFNIFHLDLSENYITGLIENHISSCQNLQVLLLARNPLTTILENSSPVRGASFTKLHTLDLSAASVTAAKMVMNLNMFSHVRNLNLSDTGLDAVPGFQVFSKLQLLDLRGCPVTYFTRSIFQGLDDLSTVYADNYKLCCPDTLPDGFAASNCHAPFDEVSSCEGLLKSGLYRVSLSVLTSVILLGNAGSFVYRVVINRPKQQSSFSLFVTNLCVSDFLMGLYSAIIGVADRLYLGNYVWNDVTWRNSFTCKIAGVMSLMSNEVSVLIICLITVDRFLVTRFPLSPQLHFSLRSAQIACATAWSVGVLLAVTPLLPVTSNWQFYSQSGICIPLPVTRRWFAGRQYSFGILIILNFVLFLVIASGQLSIYLSVRANSMATSDSTQKAKDLTIARRLVSVAMSDFLCWFPVGVLGLLSSGGHPIPSEASVFIAVFVLPLNSALNPFLYTVNVILERRQRAREQRLQKIILSRARLDAATAK